MASTMSQVRKQSALSEQKNVTSAPGRPRASRLRDFRLDSRVQNSETAGGERTMTVMAAVIVNHSPVPSARLPGRASRILTAFLKRVLSRLRYPVIHTYAALKAEHRRTHAGAPDAEDACTFASASADSPITQNKPHEDSADSDIEVSRKEKEENSAKSWHLPNQQ